MGGVTRPEDGQLKNEDGFKRFAARLLLLLISGVSRRGIEEVDVDSGGVGNWMVGKVRGILGGRGGITAEDWLCCAVIAAFEVFPIVIAA